MGLGSDMKSKRRRYFDLYTINQETGQQVWMGMGWQYDEGNCQVKLTGYGTKEFNYQGPWQFSNLSEVLRIKGVKIFEWR